MPILQASLTVLILLFSAKTMLTFMHAADLHLGAPFAGLGRQVNDFHEMLIHVVQKAFCSLVDTALEQRCSFVVLAGDILDSSRRDVESLLYFAQQMQRLHAAKVKVYIALGNHDAKSDLSLVSLPPNVHIFRSETSETLLINDGTVAIHGQSYARQNESRNLAAQFPKATPNAFNIGVLHTALKNTSPTATENEHLHNKHSHVYAPCSVNDLKTKNYHYWALGHQHGYEIKETDPWIVYPGSLCGLNIRETGQKGSVVVSVDKADSITCNFTVLSDVCWHNLEQNIEHIASLDDLVGNVCHSIQRALKNRQEKLSLVRVRLVGKTHLHDRLISMDEALTENIRIALTSLTPMICLERVIVATAPSHDHKTSDLKSWLGGALTSLDQRDRNTLEQLLKNDLSALVAKLPPDIRMNIVSGHEKAEQSLVRLVTENRYDSVLDSALEYLQSTLSAANSDK